MIKKYRISVILFLVCLIISYPAWYCLNWYVAGQIDYHRMIEFGHEDDYHYVKKWRPELIDQNSKINYEQGVNPNRKD